MRVWKESLQSNQTPYRVIMLVGRVVAGNNQLKSMHLVFLAFKSNWRPQKECCMALKLVLRFVNTVSKEGPDVYRTLLSA